MVTGRVKKNLPESRDELTLRAGLMTILAITLSIGAMSNPDHTICLIGLGEAG